jgi:hypothetical protein
MAGMARVVESFALFLSVLDRPDPVVEAIRDAVLEARHRNWWISDGTAHDVLF